MTETIALLTTLATLIIAVASLLTVLEMKRQRRSGHLPDLLLVPTTFKLIWRKAASEVSWEIMSGSAEPQRSARMSLPHFPVTLKNLGTGPAKNICTTWAFDLQEYIFALNDAGALSSKTIWNEGDTVEIESDGRSVSHGLAAQMKSSLPFLDANGGEIQLQVPPVYLELTGAYLQQAISESLRGERRTRLFDLPDPSSVTLKVNYADVGGFAYEKTFRIRPLVAGWWRMGETKEGNGNVEVTCTGTIEVEEA